MDRSSILLAARWSALCLLVPLTAAGQQPRSIAEAVLGVGTVVQATVRGDDTLLVVDLPAAHVEGVMGRRMRRELESRDRLVRNIQKVYPYARVTAQLLREYERDLSMIRHPRDQQLYIKLAEAELKAEFEHEIRDLTISQGALLIRLIDRETGRTSYELVKEMKGGFQAFVWQGVAKVFGNDLRSTYDPGGEDRMTELIVQRIERGELEVLARTPRTQKAQARLEKRRERLYKRYGLPAMHTTMN